MDIDKLCVGCFNERGPTNICQHCGYDEGFKPEAQVYLDPRTIMENKYMIGRILGQGGFGITYLAWDLNLNIKLAIKEYFPRDLATRTYGQSQVAPYSGNLGSQYRYGLDKFLQEARTLAQFEGHPNIVSVRDYFQANNSAYLVMKYVEGITLKEHLARAGGKLSIDQAKKIIMPIMDALIEVHTINVLHRDVSPDNIFINEKGQVILIDFGAARQAVSDKGHSMSIILKPGYAPEEQYRSKGNQGPWTDVYALATTLYHLITGQQPPEALERITEDQLAVPSKLGVNMNAGEEAALLKALAVRAKDRYQSIEQFQEAFMGDLLTASKKMAEPDEPTPPPMEGKKAGDQNKRFPLGLVVGGGSALIVIVALLALLIGGSGEEQNMALTEEAGEERDEIVINDSVAPGFDEPTNYIESIEAYVTDLRFYEPGYDTPEYEDMVFATTFARAESRYINWTIDLAHPSAAADRSIVITQKYYRPSGVLDYIDTTKSEFTIEADWNDSWYTWGYGWDEPGNWEAGTWYVEVLVDDKVIAAGSFEVK